MGRARLLVLALGIPGLLLYGTLATAQWRGNAALAEFNRLQKEHPSDSMETEDPKIAARKRAALALAARFIPDQSEPAYQAALQSLVLAESESLHSSGPPQLLGGGLDEKSTVLLRDSIRSINRALALNPGVAEYHFVKAMALQDLPAGRPVPAAFTAQDAVTSLLTTADRLNPYAPSLHYRLGAFQMALGKVEEAKRAFAVALTDSNRYARPVFGVLWASVRDVEELSNLVGDQPIARALLGEFLWTHGEEREAEKQFRLSASHHPIDYRTGEILVQQGIRTGKYGEARRILAEMERGPEPLTPYKRARIAYFRGNSFILENRIQDAINAYESGLDLDQGIFYIHEALADAYFRAELYDRAIARYRFILDRIEATLPPKQAASLRIGLARAYERKNRFLEAFVQSSRAVQLDPGNEVARKRALEIGREHL